MIRKSLIMLLAAILPLASCVKEQAQTEILLNLSQVSLVEGETIVLTAAVSPSSESSVQWVSVDEKVAKVENGVVTAVNPGETWVYASFGQVKEGCLIRVVEQEVLKLDRKVLYMLPHQVQLLTATYDPTLTSQVRWSSTDESVVVVEEGIVTAVADGDAYVVASIEDGKYDIECAVHVMSELTSDEIYIMSGAAGKGDSWDDAGGEDLLYALLNTTGDASQMLAGRLYGKKIHVAEGVYNLNPSGKSATVLSSSSAEGFDLQVLGGYPASGSGSRNPFVCKTVITVSDGRIFSVEGAAGKILFDGISFEKGFAGAGNYGGAFDCSLSGELVFNDCIFRQCISGFGGGAVNVNQGTLRFNDCSFESNAVDAKNGDAFDARCAGGAIRVDGQSSKVYLHNCRFVDNSAHISGDVHIEGGASAYLNRCSLYGASAVAASLGTTPKYPACSITADEGTGNTTDKTTLCLFNSTIYGAESTAYATGSPQVRALSANCLLANTTVHGFSVANVRADKRTTSVDNFHVYNCLIWQDKHLIKGDSKYAADAPSIRAEGGVSYNNVQNTLLVGKVGLYNATAPFVSYEAFASQIWNDQTSLFEWTLNEESSLTVWMKESELELKVKTAFPEFDSWLKSVDENPYEIDQIGNPRNPEKMNPGSWDPKLQ